MSGCNGRMGKYVRQVAAADKNVELVCGVDITQDPAFLLSFYLPNEIRYAIQKHQPDIWVYFSKPAATVTSSIKDVVGAGARPIIATTGFSAEQEEYTRSTILDAKVPAVWVPNFATGITVMNYIVGEAVRLLGPDYDVEISEAHHNKKADGPSGTLKKISKTIQKNRPGLKETYRQPGEFPRKADEIGVAYLREGDNPGEHVVRISGNQERLVIEHLAFSPEVFARGLVKKVIPWLSAKEEPGIYTMEDVLGINKK